MNADGKVACLIRMTRPHVVVLDPKTGEKQTVGPVTTKGEGTLDLHRGSDGRLYIKSNACEPRSRRTPPPPNFLSCFQLSAFIGLVPLACR